MRVSDFITWFRAQLDADESLVLNQWDSDGVARVATVWTGDDPGYATVASDKGDGRWVADGREVSDARHVTVLWDPAGALAEVAAWRRIVDGAILRGEQGQEDGGEVFGYHATGMLTAIKMRAAAVYAARPGYQEKWQA